MKVLMRVGIIFDRVIDILAWVACGCIIFSMLSISADVVSRQFLKLPIIWVLEVNEYLLLYITFLGTAWLLRKDGHTKMDLLVVRLNPAKQELVNTFIAMVGAMGSLVIFWSSGRSTWRTFRAGWYYETVLMTPHWVLHIVVTIGFLMLFIQFSRSIYHYQRKWKASKRGEKP